MYAGEVGVWRVLKLLDKYNIKATWFIPGEFKLCYQGFIHTFNVQVIVWKRSQTRWQLSGMQVMKC
jgi:peptidoglycan/xylan/chitin deacetylase (PgdA/CDA1 family)